MASQGPRYPNLVNTSADAPESANAWLTPTEVKTADSVEAQITAATYDAGDISYRLLCDDFGFTIPAYSTINGITVEIGRRCFAGAARDYRVQLLSATNTLVGNNKATATAWPATLGTATYGATNDTWGASPTPTMVNDPDFGVVLSVEATAANTDIGVDFVRVTVEYTPPVNTTITPDQANVVISGHVPTLTITDHKVIEPAQASVTITGHVPTLTITDHKVIEPAQADVVITGHVPDVIIQTGDTVITPDPATVSVSGHAPTLTISDHKVLTPDPASITTTGHVPSLLISDHKVISPAQADVLITGHAPDLIISDHKVITPDPATITTTGHVPDVTASDHKVITPDQASVVITGHVPDVLLSDNIVITPDPALVVITGAQPVLLNSGNIPRPFWRNRPAYWQADLEVGAAAEVASFRHLPVTWGTTLAASLIRAGVVSFGATLRHNPLGGAVLEDPYTVPEVTPVVISDPDSQRDQGEIAPLYELPS